VITTDSQTPRTTDLLTIANITAEEAEHLKLTEKDLQLIAGMHERFKKANE